MTRKTAAERKKEIIRETLRLVSRVGPERVSTSMVAKEVGITQPAIFRHFPTTLDLWLAVADWAVAEAAARWEAAIQPEDSPVDNIKAVVMAQLDFVNENPAVPSLIFSRELHSRSAELQRAFHRMVINFLGLLGRLVNEGQKQGLLDSKAAPMDLAIMLVTIVPGMVTRWFISGQAFDLKVKGEKLIDMLLQYISTPLAEVD